MTVFNLNHATSVTCGTGVRLAGQHLGTHGKTVTTPLLDARWLMDGVYWWAKNNLMAPSPDCIPPDDTPHFADGNILPMDYRPVFIDFINRRARGEPVSHILGYKWFWDSCFYVNGHVLDPRPDSEIIIEQCKNIVSADFSGRILDLGTGSGCLMATLLQLFPQSSGVAVDICPDALAVADINMYRLGVSERVELVQSSWFDSVTGTFDIIVCNPPYIPHRDKPSLPPDVLDYDPHGALFADHNGLADYQILLAKLSPYLSAGGHAVFEVGQGQAESVSAIGAKNGLKTLSIAHDYGGIGRCVVFLA